MEKYDQYIYFTPHYTGKTLSSLSIRILMLSTWSCYVIRGPVWRSYRHENSESLSPPREQRITFAMEDTIRVGITYRVDNLGSVIRVTTPWLETPVGHFIISPQSTLLSLLCVNISTNTPTIVTCDACVNYPIYYTGIKQVPQSGVLRGRAGRRGGCVQVRVEQSRCLQVTYLVGMYTVAVW